MTRPTTNRPWLAVTMGDPAGVGAEVILRAAARLAHTTRALRLAVLGDLETMRETARRLGDVPEPVAWPGGGAPAPLGDSLAVLALSRLAARLRRPGRPTVEGSRAAYSYIVAGARMALAGTAGALVTAPISKEWLNRAGHRFPGHSELLAAMAGVRRWRMMFYAAGSPSVALVTVHMALARVPRAITAARVYETIALLAEHLKGRMRVRRPVIAVLGLNPHAGENGLFGSEERTAIAPAIKQARRHGVDARGPLAPDTAFADETRLKATHGIVAMYHDQGLIGVKARSFEEAVNVTLGLPFVRTSPDHGTAYDIAGRGLASAASMAAAIGYAWRAVNASSSRSTGAAA